MSTDPSIFISPQQQKQHLINLTYKDASWYYFKKQAVYASLVLFMIIYIFTAFSILRLSSIKGILLTFSQPKVLSTSIVFSSILVGLGFIRFTQTSVWRPKHLCAGTEILAAIRNEDNYMMTFFYSLSGIFMVRYYFSAVMEESYTSEWFTYPPGHRLYARELNKENFFITFYGFLLGLTYAFKHIIEERNILRIPSVQQPKVAAIKASMSTIIHLSWKFAAAVFVCSYILFMTGNGLMYYMVAPFVGFFWTGLLMTPAVGFRWYDLYLIFRMLMAGTFVTFGWDISNRVFDVFYAVVPNVSLLSAQPHTCLLEGLASHPNNSWTRSVAYAELAMIATKSPERRMALFLDTNHDFSASAWKGVLNECILTLESLRSSLNNEYKSASLQLSDTTSITSTSSATTREVPAVQRVILKEEDIIASGNDDDDHNQQLDDRTSTLFITEEEEELSLYRNGPLPDDKWVILPRELVKKAVDRLQQLKLVKNLSTITIDQKTRAHFSNSPDLVHAAQALGSLTAASFMEDPYGYVQHDIPTVLDTLLGTLLDIEHFIQSPPPSYLNLPRLTDAPAVWSEPNSVIRALNDSIFEIATMFKDYIDQIKVQQKYRSKLATFL